MTSPEKISDYISEKWSQEKSKERNELKPGVLWVLNILLDYPDADIYCRYCKGAARLYDGSFYCTWTQRDVPPDGYCDAGRRK